MQLTRLESQLLDAPSPQLQNEHRELLEKLAKLNQHRLRRYEAAVNDWKRLIETHPNSELATEAGLAIAELIGTDSNVQKTLSRPMKRFAKHSKTRQVGLGLG